MTPALPAGSVVFTRNVWLPSAIPRSDCGDAHAWNAPPSRLHVRMAASETATAKSGEGGFGSAAGAPRGAAHAWTAPPSRLHVRMAASETATAKSGEVVFVSAAGAAVNDADGTVW